MSIWYRAHHSPNIDMVFSGAGGLYVSGRWHHKGRKVIYCSQSIALCTLEWLSHNGLSVSGFSYYKYSLEIADELIKWFSVNEHPQDWTQSPSLNTGRDFAENHLFNQPRYMAIAIPSVIIPEEYNLVLNPLHYAFTTMYDSIKKLGSFTAPERLDDKV